MKNQNPDLMKPIEFAYMFRKLIYRASLYRGFPYVKSNPRTNEIAEQARFYCGYADNTPSCDIAWRMIKKLEELI